MSIRTSMQSLTNLDGSDGCMADGLEEERLTGLMTSYVGTALRNTFFKDRQK